MSQVISSTDEKARKYVTAADGKTMIEIIGEWGYDSNNVVYQLKGGLFARGWHPVPSATTPKPIAHSVKGAKKRRN